VAAVFEKSGKTLRVFGDIAEMTANNRGKPPIQGFADKFRSKNLFYDMKKITVKEFPAEMAEALKNAGFVRDMTNYILYGKG
jgi:ATP-dependent Lhr-like helicase